MSLIFVPGVEPDASRMPPAFDATVYRQLWVDLAGLDDEALRIHYESFGVAEGRRANSLISREDFAALIPLNADVLEVGPFCRPLLKGGRVKYFDVMDKPALEQRARDIGLQDQVAPEIQFISPFGDLAIIDEQFDYVLSSHCLEHQPNFVGHLQQVSRILRPNGRYFLLLPDKRYCFDALIAESTVADVLDAYYADRKSHLLKSVIEHRALTTHNDCLRHWDGDHGFIEDVNSNRLLDAIREFAAAKGNYIDVHAWYFTPKSIAFLFFQLEKAGYIDFKVERIYSTRRHSIEFWLILQK